MASDIIVRQVAAALFLSFVALSTLVQAHNNQHICKDFKAGKFNQLDLQSFSYDFEGNYRLLYARGFRYVLDHAEADSVLLPTHHEHYSKDGDMEGPANEMIRLTETLQSAYKINLFYDKDLWDKVNIFKDGTNIFKDGTNKLVFVTSPFVEILYGNKEKKFINTYRKYPNFSLIMDHSKDRGARGFVIHVDIYGDSPFAYVIYELQVKDKKDFDDWNVHLLKPTPVHKAYDIKREAQFFYLEMTEKVNEIQLTSRSKVGGRLNASAQLFRSLPIGYTYSGSDILFDQATACVHIIHLPPLTSEWYNSSNLIFPRTSIPFERFIKCPSMYDTYANNVNLTQLGYPPDRCDRLYMGYMPNSTSAPIVDVIDDFFKDKWTFVAAGVGMFVAVVAVAVLIWYCYCRPTRVRQQKPPLKDGKKFGPNFGTSTTAYGYSGSTSHTPKGGKDKRHKQMKKGSDGGSSSAASTSSQTPVPTRKHQQQQQKKHQQQQVKPNTPLFSAASSNASSTSPADRKRQQEQQRKKPQKPQQPGTLSNMLG